MAANNHYLNTWQTWLSTGLFGLSEFTLQLPVLLAYGVFLYSTARLCRELSSPVLGVAAFVLLNGNPYTLDFFALSRGYGLAYGLIAASLWFLYRFVQRDQRARDGLMSLALAVLAVSARLTLVHYLLALAAAFVLASILCAPATLGAVRRLTGALRANVAGLTMVGPALLPTVYLLLRLRRADALFYGGSAGFWEDTLLGSVHAWLYKRNLPTLLGGLRSGPALPLLEVLGDLALLIVAAGLWTSARALVKRRDTGELFLAALVFLLLCCAAVTIVQHHLLGVLYLKSRTSVHLVILGAYVAVLLADAMARQGRRPVWLPALSALVLLNLVSTLNLTHVAKWRINADIRRMLADVAAAQEDAPVGNRPVTLGIHRSFEAPINFYRVKDDLTWLNPADRSTKFHPLNDYHLYPEEDWRRLDPDSFLVVAAYPLTESRLLRPARPPAYELHSQETVHLDSAAADGIRPGRTDRRNPRAAVLYSVLDARQSDAWSALGLASATVWMEDPGNAEARLVAAVKRDGRTYWRTATTLGDLAPQSRVWFPARLSVLVPREAHPGDRVAVYVENSGAPVYVEQLELHWFAVAAP